jgi:integrase
MPRVAKELSAKAVEKLSKTPGLHAVGGAPGLHLQVSPSGACSWVARLTVGTRTNSAGQTVQRRRDFGLGSLSVIGLAAAREKARTYAEKVRNGEDPVAEKIAARSRALADRETRMTFRKAAAQYIASMSSKWLDPKAVERRESWLETYAHPFIGDILVADIELPHVLAVLQQPIDKKNPDGPTLWHGKTETAEKLTTLLRNTLDWAAVHGYRKGKENPARIKGYLDKVLPSPSRIKNVRHHPALPVVELPKFMRDLSGRDNTTARALAVTILTGLRTNEVTNACWSEIDLDAGVWVVPAGRMKMRREHKVPLSAACVRFLRAQLAASGSTAEWVFPGMKPSKPLSSGAMLEMLKEMAYVDQRGERITTHGFRSTFRDFVSERTDYPREVAEMALAHAISDKVEAAYRRGDLLEKRRALMSDWAAFVMGDEVKDVGTRAGVSV